MSCNGKAETKTPNSKNTDSKEVVNDKSKQSNKKIVFFGDSLTAGYGLDDTNDAFPGLIQEMIDSLNLSYTVVNSGVSGETTAGGRGRINWVLNQEPSIFVLELGANDGLRGVPLSATKENLQFIIDAVREKYPKTEIVLAGMQIPPNMGQTYTQEFQSIFPDLAKKNSLPLIPFLLENVGGIAELNQDDGIHPTEEGHKIVAKNVWSVLQPLLQP
jgi:acyl-CoA thioesterase-1